MMMGANHLKSNTKATELKSALRSVLHNVGVLVVGFAFAYLGSMLDPVLGFSSFRSLWSWILAYLFLATGFFIRVWATYCFYQDQMRVISLSPQQTLITSGPYAFSRNPLYLGGNVFIFLGAALWLGSPGALILTVLHLPLMDLFVRREEKQLREKFGDEWINYEKRVRRWL